MYCQYFGLFESLSKAARQDLSATLLITRLVLSPETVARYLDHTLEEERRWGEDGRRAGEGDRGTAIGTRQKGS